MAFYSFVLLLITIFIHVAASNADSTDAAATTSEFLAPHNTARQVVGVPSLVWDKKLETFAKAYANQRRGDCLLMHSAGYAYGENIFWGEGQQWKVADIVASWVAEKQWYNYDTNSCSSSDCSHYTQIVWRNTQKVGCAKIICNSGDTFAACEYYPPGNYIGARPYTIKPEI